jgi:hypothetical protein
MMVALRPRHGFAMIRASLRRHPGFAQMMRAEPARHGFAMMWAPPTRLIQVLSQKMTPCIDKGAITFSGFYYDTITIKNELLHLLLQVKVIESGEKESGLRPDQKLFHLDG